MGKNSLIQWTDVTWNIARGCTKVDADCKNCYMYRGSLNNTRYNPIKVIKTKTVFSLPLKLKEPSRIFTSSLTDVFHPDCDSFRNEMWDIIRRCPQHTFQILTKRPERIIDCLPDDWGDGWNNVWLGTSVGSPEGVHRMIDLAFVPTKVRFLSLEPLYNKIELGIFALACYHWLIIGGESGNLKGPYKFRPCKVEWIESIIEQGKGAKIPVFVKQLGTQLAIDLKLKDRHGGYMDEWPENLRVRQFPEVKILV